MKISSLIKAYKHRSHIRKLISSQLYFLENADLTFWGSVSNEDALGIIENVKKAAKYPGPIIEIGALFGFTTQLIAAHKAVDKPLITVELYNWNPFELSPADHKVFTERALYYCIRHCNTRIYEGSNDMFYKSFAGEKPSMVFIDADHSYEGVKKDIKWAKEMAIPVICGHDYSRLYPSVMRAVNEAFGKDISITGSVWTAGLQ